MKCPNNSYCNGIIYEYVGSTGLGSRHCLDGCGYYEEFRLTQEELQAHKAVESRAPTPPKRKRKDSL
jgi:hypothetical protein